MRASFYFENGIELVDGTDNVLDLFFTLVDKSRVLFEHEKLLLIANFDLRCFFFVPIIVVPVCGSLTEVLLGTLLPRLDFCWS